MTEVVAALIFKDDRFLINRRPAHKARGLLWEFVGGKVEKGETMQEALKRECKEEMEVEIKVRDKFMEVVHVYPDLTIRLSVFLAEIIKGEPKLIEHVEMRYITPEEIDDLAFCPADVEILQKIKQVYGK